MKVKCNLSDKCPHIFCPHANIKGHAPMVVDVHTQALCTSPSECATYALMVAGIGIKKSVCCCKETKEENMNHIELSLIHI